MLASGEEDAGGSRRLRGVPGQAERSRPLVRLVSQRGANVSCLVRSGEVRGQRPCLRRWPDGARPLPLVQDAVAVRTPRLGSRRVEPAAGALDVVERAPETHRDPEGRTGDEQPDLRHLDHCRLRRGHPGCRRTIRQSRHLVLRTGTTSGFGRDHLHRRTSAIGIAARRSATKSVWPLHRELDVQLTVAGHTGLPVFRRSFS